MKQAGAELGQNSKGKDQLKLFSPNNVQLLSKYCINGLRLEVEEFEQVTNIPRNTL